MSICQTELLSYEWKLTVTVTAYLRYSLVTTEISNAFIEITVTILL